LIYLKSLYYRLYFHNVLLQNHLLIPLISYSYQSKENAHYLKQSQKDDGSWNDNASSTAWAIEGILAQNEKPEDWTKIPVGETSGNTPLDYLATLQDSDGGLSAQAGIKDSDLNTKIWETAYVASALSDKTWNQTMQTFNKEDLPKVIVEKNSTIVQKPKLQSIQTQQNTASVIYTTTPPITTPQPTAPKKNWFERLFSNIF